MSPVTVRFSHYHHDGTPNRRGPLCLNVTATETRAGKQSGLLRQALNASLLPTRLGLIPIDLYLILTDKLVATLGVIPMKLAHMTINWCC